MALSNKAKEAFRRAFTEEESVDEVVSAIESGSNPQAATVAPLGATADFSAAALSTADTYTDAAVNAELDSLVGEVEDRMDAVEAKIDAVIAALKAAGLMA